LESALSTAAVMAEVLRRWELLTPHSLEYGWYVLDTGGIGVTTSLALTVPLGDKRLPERVLNTRPSGFPNAEVDDLRVIGTGNWIDASGVGHREPRLIELSVSPAPVGLSAEVLVHHDVWAWFDFAGRPHPEIHQHNAPRLAGALEELNSVLGVRAEPGEATYFGSSTDLGIATADALDDGTGPDVTDRL
jgi:hypothetical protein